MYNEFKTVQATVDNIYKVYGQSAMIVVVQSNDGSGRGINNVSYFRTFENLSPTLKTHKVPSHALSRNYGHLFSFAYNNLSSCKSIVAITGDTLISDPTTVIRLHKYMVQRNKILACSQAIGQNFHAIDSDPENGRCGGRFQYDGISDFMPQFFVVDGSFAFNTRVFSSIPITNEYTSEQCLGDSFMKHVKGTFLDNALILAKNAYDFADGVLYQVRN
jgi:hypothetical protein